MPKTKLGYAPLCTTRFIGYSFLIALLFVVVMNKDLVVQSYKALYRYAKLFDNCPSLKVNMESPTSF